MLKMCVIPLWADLGSCPLLAAVSSVLGIALCASHDGSQDDAVTSLSL